MKRLLTTLLVAFGLVVGLSLVPGPRITSPLAYASVSAHLISDVRYGLCLTENGGTGDGYVHNDNCNASFADQQVQIPAQSVCSQGGQPSFLVTVPGYQGATAYCPFTDTSMDQKYVGEQIVHLEFPNEGPTCASADYTAGGNYTDGVSYKHCGDSEEFTTYANARKYPCVA